jgi:acyl-CoA synthetase (AMP-forming)/AMP-acid ligase II
MDIHSKYTGIDAALRTIIDVLRWRAERQPSKIAYTYLLDGETMEESITFAELDLRARAIAASILEAGGSPGDRALLLYPPSIEYIRTFFGCLYAGVIAVPAYPPRNSRNVPRIQAMVADACASVALAEEAALPVLKSLTQDFAGMNGLRWLSTDDVSLSDAERWQAPSVTGDSLAFLQYTSGSTGMPKGVMVSHSNLMHNSALLAEAFSANSETIGVTWLPPYHDMGLIGQIIDPLYLGATSVMLAPVTFLQRPYRWLHAITRHKATVSGAPNFAYDLCVRKVTDAQKATLDLSTVKVAFNGAEPVRADTLARFTAAFDSCGFSPYAFYPCYGLAEATLIVSSGVGRFLPVTAKISASALEQNLVSDASDPDDQRTLVGCGKTLIDQQIVIVNPETLIRCEPKQIGEIWVSGPSVAQGYWNRAEETRPTFEARLADTNEGPFLRTGDLGFMRDGELYITGRIKDLIVICGRNLYPNDIEVTAERSHLSLRPGCNAAFSIIGDEEERLILVQEIEFRHRPDLLETLNAIRQAVVEEHGVRVHEVVFIMPGTIPKTSSGKIQRHACKNAYFEGSLAIYQTSVPRPSRDPQILSQAGT